MDAQTLFNITAASFGFVAATWFCVGNAFISAAMIREQSGTKWGFNRDIAKSLSAQRAQYIVGASLLVATFAFQVLAARPSATGAYDIPLIGGNWLLLAMIEVAILLPLSGLVVYMLYLKTFNKVMALHSQAQQSQG